MQSKLIDAIIKQINLLINGKPQEREIIPVTTSLNEASYMVKNYISRELRDDLSTTLAQASSGEKDKIEEAIKLIADILEREQISIENKSTDEVAQQIFISNYGMGEANKFYIDKKIDEIRLAPNKRIYLTRNGSNVTSELLLEPDEIDRLITVLTPYDDEGASLDESNPTMSVVRKDGTRLTAVTKKVVESTSFALRKTDNMEINKETFIDKQTINLLVYKIMDLITRGKMNTVIYGDVNAGKSSLLKLMVGSIPNEISIRVIDIDTELKLSKLYPDKEIWELEVHDEVGADIKSLFITVLRLSPNTVIIPEFRGLGETTIAIESGIRGHRGLITTSHFSATLSIDKVIRNIAYLMLTEGANAPLDVLEERVALGLNIFIRMELDTKSGIRKVTRISEVWVDDDNKIRHNHLIEWIPKGKNYWGEGDWEIVGGLSDIAIQYLLKNHITMEEIEEVFKIN